MLKSLIEQKGFSVSIERERELILKATQEVSKDPLAQEIYPVVREAVFARLRKKDAVKASPLVVFTDLFNNILSAERDKAGGDPSKDDPADDHKLSIEVLYSRIQQAWQSEDRFMLASTLSAILDKCRYYFEETELPRLTGYNLKH